MEFDKTFTLNMVVLIVIATITTYAVLNFTTYNNQPRIISLGNICNCSPIEELYFRNNLLEQQNLLMMNDLEEKDLIIEKLSTRLNTSWEAIPVRRINSTDVRFMTDRVVISVDSAFPVSFADSNSMYPAINRNALALEVKPETPQELKVGDIIGYYSQSFNITIVHRIINISSDQQGWYAFTKGDANPEPDQIKVRFDDIKGVLVGLIY